MFPCSRWVVMIRWVIIQGAQYNSTRMHSMVNVHKSGVCRNIYIPIQWSITTTYFNPLSLHDAIKHHFTSLKTDLIFLQLRVLERKFPWNRFTNTWAFSLIFKLHQIIFIHYKSKIATAIRGL